MSYPKRQGHCEKSTFEGRERMAEISFGQAVRVIAEAGQGLMQALLAARAGLARQPPVATERAALRPRTRNRGAR